MILFKRYFYLFMYTPKLQLFHRLMNPFKRRLSHFFIHLLPIKNKISYSLPQKTFESCFFDWDAIAQDTFTFLNTSITFKNGVDYKCSDASLLWQFHLNYFDYLKDLTGSNQEVKKPSIDKAIALTDNWINASRHYHKVMWAPYTISLRIVNWIRFISAHENKIDPSMLKKIHQSMNLQ